MTIKKYLPIWGLTICTIAIAVTTLAIDDNSATLDSTPNCADGLKRIAPDPNAPVQAWSDNNSNSFYGCFTNPKKFLVKIYSVALIDNSGNEVSLLNDTNPAYLDIINNRFNPVRNFNGLSNGTTYNKVKMVIDANYQIEIDEQVASYGGSSTRIISDPNGVTSANGWSIPSGKNWITPVTNTGVTGDGRNQLASIFKRDNSAASGLVTFFHRGFLNGGSSMTLSNQGYSMYNDNLGGNGSTDAVRNDVVGDSEYGCYFTDLRNVRETFCGTSINNLQRRTSSTGQYPFQAEWSNVSSSVSNIKHSLDLDSNGNPLDYFVGGRMKVSNTIDYTDAPDANVARATITITLASPYTYDDTKGTLISWKWDTSKLFFIGFSRPHFIANSRDTVSLIGLGPYKMDLSITPVERAPANFNATENKQRRMRW
jgi:hypothetical protein